MKRAVKIAIGVIILMTFVIPGFAIYVSITDLGALNADVSSANGINEAGQIVGTLDFRSSSSSHAFFWDNGTMSDIGTLGGSSSYPGGTSSFQSSSRKTINKFGQVVGRSDTPTGYQHAFVWQKAAEIKDLGTLGGNTSSAQAINDSGQVVGVSADASGLNHAVIWQNGTITDLGSLALKCSSAALSLNNGGQVVGWSEVSPGAAIHAVMWQNGTITDLGVLQGNNYSMAVDINDSGQVIAESLTQASNGAISAVGGFIWQNGALTDLGSLGGGGTSPQGINNLGQVVGFSLTQTNYHGFLWQTGTMTDLGALGGSFSSAFDVNDSGQVVGFASDASSNIHSFVWQSGVMTALPNLGTGSNHDVLYINNAGQAAGSSIPATGGLHAVLWTILPAPPTFTIAASAGPGGTISPTGNTTVTIGTHHTFTIVPNPNYHVLNVVVDGAPQGPIMTYTFSNVTTGHTISATFMLVAVTAIQQDFINIDSEGALPVAVLGNADLDATAIDPTSVKFGPNGARNKKTPVLQDVNKDGKLDLILYFAPVESGIGCYDTAVSLTGETFSKQPFSGAESIKITHTLPCPRQ
jgi:probable HAF family extracellular repeat protein